MNVENNDRVVGVATLAKEENGEPEAEEQKKLQRMDAEDEET